jgi:hypothetical protein
MSSSGRSEKEDQVIFRAKILPRKDGLSQLVHVWTAMVMYGSHTARFDTYGGGYRAC